MAEWTEAKEKHEKAMEAKYRKDPVPPDEQFKKREPLTRAPTACDFCRVSTLIELAFHSSIKDPVHLPSRCWTASRRHVIIIVLLTP